ncbi:MAG: DNA translocase FtsK 4TM domain-containing protein [Planctomycetaceae bacterium]
MMFNLKRLGTDFLALGLLAVICFLGLSLVTYSPQDPPSTIVYPPPDTLVNWGGPIGAHLSHSLLTGLGYGAFYILIILVATDFRLFSREEHGDSLGRLLGRILILGALCVGFALYLPNQTPGPVIGSGGYLGAWGKSLAEKEFQHYGVLVILATCLIAGEMLANDLSFLRKPLKLALLPIMILLLPFRVFGSKSDSAVTTEDEDVADESAESEESLEEDEYEDEDEEEEEDEEYDEDEEYEEDEEEEYDEEEEDEEAYDEPEKRAPIKVNPPWSTTESEIRRRRVR